MLINSKKLLFKTANGHTWLSGEISTSVLPWYHVVPMSRDLIQTVLITSPAEVAVRWTRRRDLTWCPYMW